MMDGPQSLAACIAVLKTLLAEAKQKFGLSANTEPRLEGLLRWPLRFYVAGKDTPVYAEVSLHREYNHPPHFSLRYGGKPGQVALKVFPQWNGATYELVFEEPDGCQHPSLRHVVAQMKDIAATPLELPAASRATSTEARSLF